MNRNIQIDLRKLIRIMHVASLGEKSIDDIFKIYKIPEPKNAIFEIHSFQDILKLPIGTIVEFEEKSNLGKGQICYFSNRKILKLEKYGIPVEINNDGFPWDMPLKILIKENNEF